MSNTIRCITAARAARVGLALSLLAATAAPAPAAEMSAAERQKIEALIKHVEGLRDAKFVRNGSEYDTAAAGPCYRRAQRGRMPAWSSFAFKMTPATAGRSAICPAGSRSRAGPPAK